MKRPAVARATELGQRDGMRIAIISDVHANAFAYKAALSCARARGFDHLVILGDLLTYGCSPRETIDLTMDAVCRDRAFLVKGNHDQLYFDLASGRDDSGAALPDWIRETANWTAAALAGVNLERQFPWQACLNLHGIFFAHANPFAYGDWTYLSAPAECRHAAAALRERGYDIGVFGHTHRPKIVEVNGEQSGGTTIREVSKNELVTLRVAPHSGTIIIDAGSAGQPRDRRKMSAMMFVTASFPHLFVETVALSYDVKSHRSTLLHSSLSDMTKQRLLAYLPAV